MNTIVFVILFSGFIILPNVYAHSGTVFDSFANTIPTIDGIIDENEWNDAYDKRI